MTDGLAGPNQPLSQGTRLALQSLFEGPRLPATQCLPGIATPLPYNDFNYLMRAIEVLRHVEGEKHVVFVAERAPGIGQGDFVAKKAAAARVTVSILQTGGVEAANDRPLAATPPGSFGYASLPHSPPIEHAMDRVNQRSFAEQTGGIAAFYQAAAGPLTRLARATSFQYSLGYYPATLPRDGEYRQLRIAVRRPGVTVLYRHGYEASPQQDGEPSDVRQMFVTNRILDGAALPPSAWLPRREFLKYWTPMTALSASATRSETGEEMVRIDITVNVPALMFTRNGDRESGVLDVAVFVEDAKENRVGEKWDPIEVSRDASAQRKELVRVVRVPVTGRAAQVKVVVYEYETDHLRVVTLRLPQQ